jgi:predicted MPP superfamily phosphohydrolase
MSQIRRINRRQFLKFMLGASAGAAGAALGGSVYTTLIEPQWLSVERIEVPLARLPRDLDGFTIAQLSDLHLGPYVGADEIRAAVAATNQLQPDAIVLTGDYVTREADRMDECANELRALSAASGVFSVLGNHDYWSGPEHITRALESNSISVLINNAVPIERAGARLWIAGVDDVWERRADLDSALRLVPSTELTILLAHEPDYAELAKHHAIDLQLSGHSHGGQVRLPHWGAPILPYLGKQFPIGLKQADSMWVYTNRGIGVVSPPVRFNCRPEITLLTLRHRIDLS